MQAMNKMPTREAIPARAVEEDNADCKLLREPDLEFSLMDPSTASF
jgi:hypothetical protein